MERFSAGGSEPWLRRVEKAACTHTFFQPPPVTTLAALETLGGAIGAAMLVP